MPRFLISFSYDGTDFSGWQIQPDVRTVQETLENCLQDIQGYKVKVTGSGRTDAKVHALKQYAHFDLDNSMSTEQIISALNSKLPADIIVNKCWKVKEDFSARYDAVTRTYQYHLTLQYSPFTRNYAAWLPRMRFSKESLICYLHFFLGKHDFSAFARQNPDLNHYRCNVISFDLDCSQKELIFTIKANRFLHNMVRRIVGTCLRLSHTNSNPEIIKNLLEKKEPKNYLIYTAPPQGLFLSEVEYPGINY